MYVYLEKVEFALFHGLETVKVTLRDRERKK